MKERQPKFGVNDRLFNWNTFLYNETGKSKKLGKFGFVHIFIYVHHNITRIEDS